MPFLRRIPQGPLSEYVAMIWYYYGQPLSHAMERLLPTGSIELVINLRENQTRIYDQNLACRRLEGIAFCGIQTGYFVIDTDEQQHIMGVHFRSGGTWAFLDGSAQELKDLHVSAGDVWGQVAQDLRAELLDAPTLPTKFDTVEGFLSRKLRSGASRHPAVTYALRHMQSPACKLGEITGRLGMSQRKFIELFTYQVGLTPKVFARIMRFQRAVQQIGTGQKEIDWNEIALRCGYYDQAHFINDFRNFSGINPTTYRAKCNEHLNHVPLDEPRMRS